MRITFQREKKEGAQFRYLPWAPFYVGTPLGRQPYSMRTKKTWIPISKDFRSQEKRLTFLNYLSTSSQEDKKLPQMTPLKYCITKINPRQCVRSPMPKYAVWC
ncbi:hypothetical protein AVEN_134776-1 [Araneus ventricosus]|uniref:Uncharacterized protein n=1 Tax=Araneus ventricosus TaxID=182803 RepID=A0A4Y2G9B2_ARAVE|nr:hypothetical protein AVEN_134776-1 [Araneus ventricosus]